MLPENEIGRVLAVVAHPDDVDFAAAATVARFTDRGAEVVYCVVTDGDAGGFERRTDGGGMAGLRRDEQRAAAEVVGVRDLRFLGYRDGVVEQTLDLRRDIARVIRQVRPDLVITHSPERNYSFVAPSHPDHRAVGGAAVDAVYPDARNPYAFPGLLREEGLAAWTVREVWLDGHETPDHYVDVTGTFERKLAALRAHASQTAHVEGFEESIREHFSRMAERAGFGPGRYAEAFKRVVTV
ncbi:PIG-L family deacetylase [Planomonospora alba]|uniref:PIG-L family deacetylase n=1 Tax=Planomonospora alba TaxID=161354 RepID=A0ABP6N510_9ACTN